MRNDLIAYLTGIASLAGLDNKNNDLSCTVLHP
jgi:hypothetical protein